MKKLKLAIFMVLALLFTGISHASMTPQQQERVNVCVHVANTVRDISHVYQFGILTPSEIRAEVRNRPQVIRQGGESALALPRYQNDTQRRNVTTLLEQQYLAECMKREFPLSN